MGNGQDQGCLSFSPFDIDSPIGWVCEWFRIADHPRLKHCTLHCQLQSKTWSKMSSIILTGTFKIISTIFYFITYSIKSLHFLSYQSQPRCFVLLQNSILEKRFHPWKGNKMKNVILFLWAVKPSHNVIFLHNDSFCFRTIMSKKFFFSASNAREPFYS